MRIQTATCTIVLLLLAAPVLAGGVYVDYDPNADLSSYGTFTWVDTPGTSLEYHNKLMHSRVKNYIEHLLTEAGLVEDDESPDLTVTYHASAQNEMALDVATYGYSWGPSFMWDPYWNSTWGTGTVGMTSTTVRSYDVGTFIIDLVEADTKNLLWRGSATGIVVPEDPRKVEKKIYKSIDKMVNKFRKMKAKEEK
jgi:hypothetical protein